MGLLSFIARRIQRFTAEPAVGHEGDIYYNTTSHSAALYTGSGWDPFDTGTGDVVGPASSTDNAAVRWDGITGKLSQDSVVLIGDTGNITGLGTLNTKALPSGNFGDTSSSLAQFASTTSAQLRTLLSDENGTGVALFDSATSPTFITPALGTPSAIVLTNATGTAASLTAGAVTGFTAGAGVLTGPASSGVATTLGNNETLTGIKILTPTARSSGALPYFSINIPADTAQTASTESPGFKTVTGIRQWATGALTTQRENLFAGPTIAFAGASTLMDGFTVGITPVVQGTNATITRIHSLGILDPTSAASSITGGLVVATAFGTTATSVGIGGGNINAGGTLTVGGAITPSQTAGIVGTTTNNSANAGSVGEYVEGTLASGSATSLTTATAKTITSISLTAGDWDVTGIVFFAPAATTSVTELSASISQTNNTLDVTLGRFIDHGSAATVYSGQGNSAAVPSARISLSGTTTVYLVGYAAFSVSTMTAYGVIHARRMR